MLDTNDIPAGDNGISCLRCNVYSHRLDPTANLILPLQRFKIVGGLKRTVACRLRVTNYGS